MENLNLVVNKKDTVLERLNKRNKDRQNYLETKLEIRSRENPEFEGADYFAQNFSESAKEIEKNINNVQSNCIDLSRTFAGITNDILELQKYLSNSTMFLPDYNIKACQNILNELTAQRDEIRQKLMPKKKFGFHNKRAVVAKKVTPKNIDQIDFDDKKISSSTTFLYTLSNRQNEYILLMDTDVDKKDITISNLKNCFVEIRGHAGSVQISKADNCVFLCGPIARSIFSENCSNCNIVAACQQLRLHSSTNIKLWLYVTCRAIIEDCTKIEVGKYNYKYSGIEIDFKKSGLDETANNYADIADFNWLSPDQPSPNWKIISQDVQVPDWLEIREEFRQNIKL